MKKLIVIFMAFLLTFLSGCTGGEKAQKLANVTEDGKYFYYSIVRPKGCAAQIENSAKNMRTLLRKAYKTTVIVSYGEEEDFEGNLEILIGNTGRAESEQALNRIKENRDNNQFDFIIKVIGDKICITALKDEMIAKAVEYFTEKFCKNPSDWEKLNTNTEFIYEAPFEGHPHALGGVEIKNFTIVTVRDMEYIYGRNLEEITDYFSNSQGYVLNQCDERSKETQHEILVGDLNREASKKVTVRDNNWIIKMVDGKLVIKGGNSLALSDAIDNFFNLIKKSEKEGSYIDLASDYELKGEYAPSDDKFQLVWNDEFNSNKLNTHWWVDYSSQDPYGTTTGSSLGGECVKKAVENTKMTGDGCLTIFSTRNGKDFTSGSVSTWDTLQLKYGIIEFRMKLPIEPGCGALWFNSSKLGYGCMTEYDLLENFGSAKTFASNLHRWWLQNGSTGHTSLDIPEYSKLKRYTFKDPVDDSADLSTDFHIYTMEWDEHIVNFAVDGKTFFSYSIDENDNPDSRKIPAYMLMSCSMGAANYGQAATADCPEYVEMKVDYVRVYQRADTGAELLTRDKGNIPNYTEREIEYYVGGKRIS